ncbi:type II CRISPR-associated endonuclease Cas1 [Andreprevotia chitinilytica]|uniref:type II CRISPR-associated endonuclease Cas1 n=1 Tax=Andreprevotia chitinilytica TaxID=396808 RepID=UPI00068EC99E|nr:type II CRISPR-associated endonuclease Cas1 [Andreprevotia chitinilytica]
MGWRSVIISQPARLSVKNRQLLLEQETGVTATLPLEDLSVVVLETPRAMITSALLSELATHDVALITCDETHHPNGVLLPYLPHSRALRAMQKQLALTVPQKKRAWQSIVQQKLRNQGECLNRFLPGAGRFLFDQAERVRSGDPDNREGGGARYYFVELFGRDFTREQDDWINAALNYGYAIIRAAIARSLVGHGFLPAFGLHHKNQLNAFNLADDLIEPLRPLVDGLVRAQVRQGCDALITADKAGLAQLLYADVRMNAGVMNVLTAIEHMVESLGRYCENTMPVELDWPIILS